MASSLEIADRVEILGKQDSYILLMDHKQSFYREKQARLINPTKNPLGRISNFILDKINSKGWESVDVLQLRSTQDAIDWFENIPDKRSKGLVKGDIEFLWRDLKYVPPVDLTIFKEER